MYEYMEEAGLSAGADFQAAVDEADRIGDCSIFTMFLPVNMSFTDCITSSRQFTQ